MHILFNTHELNIFLRGSHTYGIHLKYKNVVPKKNTVCINKNPVLWRNKKKIEENMNQPDINC